MQNNNHLPIILSGSVLGLEAELIQVEADVSNGLPKFLIVGLPDASVQEAKERVRSAIKNSGCVFPRTPVTVNLAPADIKKQGTHYDLPIAMSILLCRKELKDNPVVSNSLFIGELSLNGELRAVNGVISLMMLARNKVIKNVFLPLGNVAEASLIKGVNIYGIQSLSELIGFINGGVHIFPAAIRTEKRAVSPPQECDFSCIRGHEQVKRALEIAVAGAHNILFSGTPGSGKTYLARAIPSILPEMREQESLEVTKIYSVAGQLSVEHPLIDERPFRSPHHTASTAALVGGGSLPKPGEITLAHRGVLFLDELPEFSRGALESLRQPLEDGVITVSRARGNTLFPAKFMLVAAMNPCPCGFLNDPERQCTCTPSQIIRYQKRISGPLLDRIDLKIEVPRIKFEKIIESNQAEPSGEIRKRIEAARLIQRKRYQDRRLHTNSEMSNQLIRDFCAIKEDSLRLLKNAVQQMSLSARSYFRILKVSRTIADLEGRESIDLIHVAEALQYRMRHE